MKGIRRKATTLAAAFAASAALAVLPGPAAQADGGDDKPLPCHDIVAVCVWSETNGGGELRLLFGTEPIMVPPASSAQNQTEEPWCLYSKPIFLGTDRVQLEPGETVGDLGFKAYSAKPGPCEEPESELAPA